MAEALLPLREAGIRLRTIVTPAVALASLARMRQPAPACIESYIALDERVTCIALVRGGVLLAARDWPWGYISEGYAQRGPQSRDDITARLA